MLKKYLNQIVFQYTIRQCQVQEVRQVYPFGQELNHAVGLPQLGNRKAAHQNLGSSFDIFLRQLMSN